MIFIVCVLVVDSIVTECDFHILYSTSFTYHFVQMQVVILSLSCVYITHLGCIVFGKVN